ncbi:TIGR04338 family metallohydrolase [Mycobacterium sp. 1274756.6]|uniref:TIGR04338 family metallohydrolase n=1 Tax=Mycobacterium sp. 1274756.6 TaxID=1834076 RepID=UPI000801A750|nr:TIGR04338 family metallohydrolase [Mycobacterium sp. 1274756.6]OBJ73953.1 hypothetical protein A5643_02580 [Mycobacterium sp. 1274756.6]
MSARDSQRAKVYAAEEFVRTVFDRAAARGSRTVEFFGANLTLPPEARFGSVAAVQAYVDEVLALPAVREQWPDPGPLTVRERRGVAAAHYEKAHDEQRAGTAVVAVPARGGANWAMRELVVLHELAHHLCAADPPHGPRFVATLCTLAALVMGPEVGHVLRVVYAREGVS